MTSHSSRFLLRNTAGTSTAPASLTAYFIASDRFRRSTLLHSICTPGSPITSASPFAPQYYCPLRQLYPYSRRIRDSSRSPPAPFCLLFIPCPFLSLTHFPALPLIDNPNYNKTVCDNHKNHFVQPEGV